MPTRHAFSLIELTIMIAILAILAALVVPRFADAQDDASEAATQTNLAIIERQVEIYHQTYGAYPDDLDRGWFVGGALPANPLANFNTASVVEVDTSAAANQTEPAQKVMVDLSDSPWWYNPKTGEVRARVSPQSDLRKTLLMYNRVNGVEADSMTSIIAARVTTTETAPSAPAGRLNAVER
ncbi:MAG: hypothetical protein AAGH92_06205 [Planctomycetota bacterium]